MDFGRPGGVKPLECVRLAGALGRFDARESGSKLPHWSLDIDNHLSQRQGRGSYQPGPTAQVTSRTMPEG
jgi:hypothetical protein